MHDAMHDAMRRELRTCTGALPSQNAAVPATSPARMSTRSALDAPRAAAAELSRETYLDGAVVHVRELEVPAAPAAPAYALWR